ncbi:coiled-coil domain-containing protein 42-like [Nyctibius grandis]|uniref:coiled-coil domain-containing protein 42-like n=1 Tax=Nyctibius grandis TaxID=48427 RepID=UPI0035BC7948
MASGGDDEDLLAYFHMQYRQNLLSLIRKLRVTEEESPSQLIHLQEKKKQVRLMQKALEEKKEAFREKMNVLSCRWRDLHTKNAQLKTHTETSGRILKENEKMRVKALMKARKERERKTQKESELLRAKRQLEALRNEHQELCKRVQKYSIFKKYLEDVVKVSQFKGIQEIVRHYETMVRKRKDLLQSRQDHKEMFEQAKVLLDQYTAEKEAEILQYTNDLVQLQQRFDQARSDIRSWENSSAEIQNATTEKAQHLGTIKLATLNLFQLASTRLKSNLKVPVDDSHRQLDMIKDFIQDLTDIYMEAKHKAVLKRQRAAIPTEL